MSPNDLKALNKYLIHLGIKKDVREQIITYIVGLALGLGSKPSKPIEIPTEDDQA